VEADKRHVLISDGIAVEIRIFSCHPHSPPNCKLLWFSIARLSYCGGNTGMPHISIGRILGCAAIFAAWTLAQPSQAQTVQQLQTCQGKRGDDPTQIIRACSIFIETGHAVGGRPLPTIALNGILELRGNAYIKKADTDLAIADYSSALRLHIQKYEHELYYNRGNSYFQKQDYDRAIADYSSAIGLNSKKYEYYNNRGNAYLQKKDYDRAIADYDESIRQDAKSPLPYIGRGNAYAYQGEYERAIASYKEAFQIDPKNTYARMLFKLNSAWARYLQEIREDGDYANWSGPPGEIHGNAK
jgi:tetratricopeptide (TPR) repeat protein